MSKIILIADATCRVPNANIKGRAGYGHASCGFLILDELDNILHQGSEYLGDMTVPRAEMKGLITGMECAPAFGRDELEVRMDSELVIKWMNGLYRMKKDEIRILFDQVKIKEKRFNKVIYMWHNRNAKWAREADKLANQKYSEMHSG